MVYILNETHMYRILVYTYIMVNIIIGLKDKQTYTGYWYTGLMVYIHIYIILAHKSSGEHSYTEYWGINFFVKKYK